MQPLPIHDPRLLLAILAPLLGAGLVMATGKRPNLREGCSLAAAITLFAITASLIPDIFAGHRLQFEVFRLWSGSEAEHLGPLSITLRADPLSMVFAVSASFLWMVTVFYSAGYMRGLHEHAQTRFNTCFALALFGAVGCACARRNLERTIACRQYAGVQLAVLCKSHHQLGNAEGKGLVAVDLPAMPGLAIAGDEARHHGVFSGLAERGRDKLP